MSGNAENGMLEKIVASVTEDLQRRMLAVPMGHLQRGCRDRSLPPPRGFRKALQQEGIRIIAEVKRASPSRGFFPFKRTPAEQAIEYAEAGAACISVVTETRFFAGSLEMLADIRCSTNIPLLRKDFFIDPYQIYEARLAGADAILLIAAVLEDIQLRELSSAAAALGLDVLVEVTGPKELERALEAGAQMVGVNNRNLKDFSIDVERSLALAPLIPQNITAVSESGICETAQIARLRRAGYRGFLIGEHLMLQDRPGDALRQLLWAGDSSDSSTCA